MPGKRKGCSKASLNPPSTVAKLNFEGNSQRSDSNTSSEEFTSAVPVARTASKRKHPSPPQPTTASRGMNDTMSLFGIDFAKALQNKRKKLENFTNASLTSSDKKIQETSQLQREERSKLAEGYSKQVSTVLTQWEEDMQKTRESEEKLLTMMKQHHRTFQQLRIVQTQRFKTLKQLHEDFMEALKTLDQHHSQQTLNMQDELKEELTQLKKKVLMESQQQEISSIRRSLQAMLAQVGEE